MKDYIMKMFCENCKGHFTKSFQSGEGCGGRNRCDLCGCYTAEAKKIQKNPLTNLLEQK